MIVVVVSVVVVVVVLLGAVLVAWMGMAWNGQWLFVTLCCLSGWMLLEAVWWSRSLGFMDQERSGGSSLLPDSFSWCVSGMYQHVSYEKQDGATWEQQHGSNMTGKRRKEDHMRQTIKRSQTGQLADRGCIIGPKELLDTFGSPLTWIPHHKG